MATIYRLFWVTAFSFVMLGCAADRAAKTAGDSRHTPPTLDGASMRMGSRAVIQVYSRESAAWNGTKATAFRYTIEGDHADLFLTLREQVNGKEHLYRLGGDPEGKTPARLIFQHGLGKTYRGVINGYCGEVQADGKLKETARLIGTEVRVQML